MHGAGRLDGGGHSALVHVPQTQLAHHLLAQPAPIARNLPSGEKATDPTVSDWPWRNVGLGRNDSASSVVWGWLSRPTRVKSPVEPWIGVAGRLLLGLGGCGQQRQKYDTENQHGQPASQHNLPGVARALTINGGLRFSEWTISIPFPTPTSPLRLQSSSDLSLGR